jgi:histidinol-phosphate aminotransferase
MKNPVEIPYEKLANPAVLAQPAYEPGRPIEVVAREFGLDPGGVLKLASNESAVGPSPGVLAAAGAALREVNLYPDGAGTFLCEKLAVHWGLGPGQFLLGNGSNEVMILLAQAFLRPGDEVVFGSEAFIVYRLAALMFGAVPVAVPMPAHRHDLGAMLSAVTPRTKLVFLANPNNPTGTVNGRGEILAFARALPPHVVLCVDEAYAEFLPEGEVADIRPLIAEGVKVVGARTFSKIHGLAGLRVGYLYGARGVVALLQRIRQPFNVNAVAQAAACAALEDVAFVRAERVRNARARALLEAGLEALGGVVPGIEMVPGSANFVFFKVPRALAVFDMLQRQGIIVRPMSAYGLPDYLRVSVGTEAQNARFLSALRAVLLQR